MGMSQYNAARSAGYSHNTANKAHRIEERVVGVKGGINEELEQIGLTDKVLSEHARAGLNATRTQSCDVYVSASGDNYELNENSNDFIEVPDWNARHKYLQTILKLKGKLVDQPLIKVEEHTHFTFIKDALTKSEGIDASGRIKEGTTKPAIHQVNGG